MKREAISQGLALVPSGVFVLATVHEGQSSAILASFIQQAAFDPPMIVAAVGQDRSIGRMIRDSKQFAVSVMSKDSKESLSRFWKGVPEGADPFDGLSTSTHDTGIPILSDAVGFLECKLRETLDAGDHFLCLGEVVNGGRVEDGEPFIRIRKNGFDY
jgi:flavin reductase (DIM6/NTAB) family NADH-FMN oxidoreductase RutF